MSCIDLLYGTDIWYLVISLGQNKIKVEPLSWKEYAY